MRSIQARFNHFNREPNSSYLAFSRAIEGREFCRDNISRNFVKLVDKDDYSHKDKNILIDHLYKLSNTPLEHEIEEKQASDE